MTVSARVGLVIESVTELPGEVALQPLSLSLALFQLSQSGRLPVFNKAFQISKGLLSYQDSCHLHLLRELLLVLGDKPAPKMPPHQDIERAICMSAPGSVSDPPPDTSQANPRPNLMTRTSITT